MKKEDNEKYFYQFKKYKISKEEIDRDFDKIVMTVRPSMEFDLSKMIDIDGGNIIYSMWKGYLSKDKTMEFMEYLENRNFELHHIHTSGHADFPTLQKIVEAIQPKYIVPIHTFEKDKYKDLFNIPVIELDDKEILEV